MCKNTFKKEKTADVFAVGEEIILCKSRDEDRADYIRLQMENTVTPSVFKMEGIEDILWEVVNDEKTFYVAIRRKSDDAYMGYCSIKNIHKAEPELVIEILKEFHGNGYGQQALTLFMTGIKKSTGISSFIALVDGENTASQKICEACGGVPAGITEHLLHDKDYMEEYEQENQDMITDQMREVAGKFAVPAEKLLTHVLVYRFDVEEKFI